MTTIPDRLECRLYQHHKTDDAVLLSPDGNPNRAEWFPLAFVTMPLSIERPTKPHGEPVRLGTYCIEEWKVKAAGWLMEKDERQGELL